MGKISNPISAADLKKHSYIYCSRRRNGKKKHPLSRFGKSSKVYFYTAMENGNCEEMLKREMLLKPQGPF